MIAVCSNCHNLFETTTEDAYTPGVLCVKCYRQFAYFDAMAATPGKATGKHCPFCETGRAIEHSGHVCTCTVCDVQYANEDDLPAEVTK